MTNEARLRKAIEDYLAGDYARPVGKVYRDDGKPSKNDQCIHGAWMYAACEGCVDAHFSRALVPDTTDAE